jgi:hypothetical protein
MTKRGAAVSDDDTDYETVAASQTGQVLGAAGAKGDVIRRLVIVPTTVAPGVVTILDGGTSIPVFVGGATELKPIPVELCVESKNGAWSITTGANVSVVAIGRFT